MAGLSSAGSRGMRSSSKRDFASARSLSVDAMSSLAMLPRSGSFSRALASAKLFSKVEIFVFKSKISRMVFARRLFAAKSRSL